MSSKITIIRLFPSLTPHLFTAIKSSHHLLRILPAIPSPPIFLQDTTATLNELIQALSNFYSASTFEVVPGSEADDKLLDGMISLAGDIDYVNILIDHLVKFYHMVSLLSADHISYYRGTHHFFKPGREKEAPAPHPPTTKVRRLLYTPNAEMKNLLYSLSVKSGKWLHISREFEPFRIRSTGTAIPVTNQIWKLDPSQLTGYSIIREQDPDGWVIIEIPTGSPLMKIEPKLVESAEAAEADGPMAAFSWGVVEVPGQVQTSANNRFAQPPRAQDLRVVKTVPPMPTKQLQLSEEFFLDVPVNKSTGTGILNRSWEANVGLLKGVFNGSSPDKKQVPKNMEPVKLEEAEIMGAV
ncbi:hypothetical protein FPQ18DRAFT_391895 [Pyronema domesticum]|nr:hypothetical protein FPQ18DRAFT_391895 [Pyronema domesticum]